MAARPGYTYNEGYVTSTNHSRKEPDGTSCLTGYWFGATSSLFVNPGAWWHTIQKGQDRDIPMKNPVLPGALRNRFLVGAIRHIG